MSGKSASNSPSKSKVSKTPNKNSTKFEKIIGHNKYDTHYVEYQVRLKNGQTINATEFDFENDVEMLANYKQKVTKQTDDANGEYVVEKIITHRIVNGKPLFLVQWKGYTHCVWNSELWERDLSNCKPLLESYKAANNLSTALRTPVRTPKKSKTIATPKSISTAKSPRKRPQEEVNEPASSFVPKKQTKKTLSAEKSKPRVLESDNDDEMEDEIERVEEVQSDDDDDEVEENVNQPSTSGAQAKPSSRWTLNFWKWF
uniref:Chromo domain-containing protein n=1 Tax=Caenorhabditis tropicalis TaxID=1561998 RepID=A0A1I7V0L4_9PELO